MANCPKGSDRKASHLVFDIVDILLAIRREEYTSEEAILEIEKIVWPEEPERGTLR